MTGQQRAVGIQPGTVPSGSFSVSVLAGPAPPLLALVLGAVAYLPLVLNAGFLNTRAGGDSPFLLVRLQQLVVALQGGVFPVRWMPDAAYGLGYPFFNYYAPLAYYLGALACFLGFGYLGALKLTQIAGFVVAGLAMYRLAADTFHSRPAGLLASLVYTYAPFHLVNVYVRGDSLGEFWAFAFYPLIILALRRLRDRPTLPNAAWLGLAYAGLVLSHNLSAFIFTPFALLYALILPLTRPSPPTPLPLREGNALPLSGREQCSLSLWERAGVRGKLRIYLLIAVGLALGLALSAFYWLPALAEQDAVQLSRNLTGYFDYHGHFREEDLVQAGPEFNYEVTERETAFAMGLVQAGLMALGGLALLAGWLRRRRVEPVGTRARGRINPAPGLEPLLALLTTLSATWLITSSSAPVWNHLPLLPFVQFPWRFLSVQAFGGSLVTGALVGGLGATNDQRWIPLVVRRSSFVASWPVALVAGGLSLWAAMARLPVDFLPITDADVTPDRLALYEWFTGNIGSTVRAEYLPAGVARRPYSSANFLNGGTQAPPNVTSGQAAAQLVHQGPADELWHIDVASAQADLVFHTFWFPGWQATVDDHPVPVTAMPGSGLIGLSLPAGQHAVALAFGRTPVRLAGEVISLLAVLSSIGLAVAIRPRRSLAAIPLAILLVTRHPTPNTQYLTPDPQHPSLTWDFNRMPYLHPNPAGQSFGGMRLRRYTLSADEIQPGSELTVALDWDEPLLDKRVDVALMTPAVPVLGVTEFLATASAQPAPTTTLQLAVPESISRGVYLVRVRVKDRDSVFLAPVRVPARPAPSLTAYRWRFGDAMALTDISVERFGGSSIQVNLTWQALRPLAVNYATSLRFLDASGQELASDDAPPLYGFFPTTAWQPGEAVFDRRRLVLPKDLPARSDYRLQVIVYDPASLQPIGQAELPGVTLTEPTR
jgi:hypothetical protein